MSLMRDVWTGEVQEGEGLLSYVLNIRDRLTQMSELAQENLHQVQVRQRQWYDCNARERNFSVGDRVLVLRPTDTIKLKAQWQGPFEVTRQVPPVDYEVYSGHRLKSQRLKVCHVNMLRRYEVRDETCLLTRLAEDDWAETRSSDTAIRSH